MVYIEGIKRGNKTYYYITKNFRVALNKWKKIRKYVGEEKPSKNKIKKVAKLIEKEALEKGLKKPKTKYRYLTNKQAEVLEDLKVSYSEWWKSLPKESREKFEDDFLVRFTYNSNAIEGNTLSLRETNMILQEKIIPSDINEMEYKEVVNGKKVMEFVKSYSDELNGTFLLEVHKILTSGIIESAGTYRNHDVIIEGSNLIPPHFKKVPTLMKKFFIWYNNYKKKLHPLELAGLVHAKFVRIHPFSDGNGRTSRILMNFILNKNSYPMFLIENSKRKEYYNALEKSDAGDDKPFIQLIFRNIVKQHKTKQL